MNKKIFLTLIGCTMLFSQTDAQQQNTSPKEMRYNISEDGKQYLKWTFLNQLWFRYNESNPGTTVLGEPANETFDIGLRRTRIQFFGQLTEHVFFYTQFGQNNFNFLSQNTGNRKLQVFFHDALGEYKVWPSRETLILGGGLTITNGLSRFSQPSIGTIMTMDVPIFAQATVDQTDEFSRKLSVYARGQWKTLDYRFVLSDPFPITTNGQAKPVISENASFATTGHHKQYQTLLICNLLEKEPHTTPYMTGTYLGKKKILNIEAGAIYQKNATETGTTDASTSTVSNISFHDMKLFSVAAYFDSPLNVTAGSAISAYAGYFNYDYGPGYLRYNGIMNPADGITNGPAPGSQGNAFPMFGTGRIVYAQFGYLLNKNTLPEGSGQLMPYLSITRADLQRLNHTMTVFNTGINWLMQSHGAKLTLDYQVRPFFAKTATGLEKQGNKNQLLIQYQVFF